MKKITIYPTAIAASGGIVTLDDLMLVNGFEELLNNDITAERFKELADAFCKKRIEIVSAVAPDGLEDEDLIDKEILKDILEANKNGGGAYAKYFDAPKTGSYEFDRIYGNEQPKNTAFSNTFKKIWNNWCMFVFGAGLLSFGFLWLTPIVIAIYFPLIGIPLTIATWIPIIMASINKDY